MLVEGMNRRGKFTITQLLGLVLSVGIVIILFLILVRVISPVFDSGAEAGENYFNLFLAAIDDAGGDSGGRFLIWQPDGDVGVNVDKNNGNNNIFYLVYFGEKAIVKLDVGNNKENKFRSFGVNTNHVCICYFDIEEKETHCDYCKDMDKPLRLKGESAENWFIGSGDEVDIFYVGGNYVLEKR